MLWTRLAAALAVITATVAPALSAPLEIVVQTEIRDKTAAFQAGIKSIQKLSVDFDAQSVTSAFSTGTTDIGVTDLKSVRDNFTATDVWFDGSVASFKVVGQTASGVRFMPNINYALTFKVDNGAKSVTIGGCHDGYPSYEVTVGSSKVYSFEQEYLLALFGSCDALVAVKSVY